MATKTTMDDKPAPKKGRGYIAYSTQSKDQGNVPGKKFNVIGVPGATVAPQPWEIRQQQTPQAGAADASRGNADVQPGTAPDDGKPAKIVYRVPTRDGKRLVQQVAVPGATVPPGYANNQTHAAEQGEDARPNWKPMARPTYNSTGSLMLPTKKRKADGTDLQVTPDLKPGDSGTVEIPRRTHQTAGGDKAEPVVPAARSSQSTTPQGPQEPQLDSYDKMLEYMRANQVADADAAGRARRRELMAAIGDGISAVSSLYQTTKGAPVTYTPGADMSKAMRDRYDRMIAQRKADSDKYLNYLRVQQAKEQADELREYKRTNQEIRREELERQKKNDKAREDYRNMGLRLRDLERQRKIANSPGGDVYFKTLQDMIAEGYSEEDAENEAMKELAAYNTQHGTNYTIVDKRDNSGRVSRTVTVKTNDQQTADQVEQVANNNVGNTPPPAKRTKSSRKSKGGSNSNKSGSNKAGGLKPNKLGL